MNREQRSGEKRVRQKIESLSEKEERQTRAWSLDRHKEGGEISGQRVRAVEVADRGRARATQSRQCMRQRRESRGQDS